MREPVQYQPTEHAETADLLEHRQDLGAQWRAIAAGAAPRGGRLWGLPELPDDEVWVDIAGASVIARVAPSTITSWLARGGPKRNPWPAATRVLYRLYWPMATIRAWVAEQKADARR